MDLDIIEHSLCFGTYKCSEENILSALETGYRFLDTAFAYDNHESIGVALQRAAVPREELFLASKIAQPHHLDAIEDALEKLQTTYLDLLYLHTPDLIQPEILRQCQMLKKSGAVHCIGLSNVTVRQAKAVILSGVEISAIQNECNPYYQPWDIIDFCRKEKIAFAAYRPFRDKEHKTLFSDQVLRALASNAGLTVSQLVLRWLVQQGLIPVVRSGSRKHQKENFSIPPLSLSQQALHAIKELNRNLPSCDWEKYADPDLLAKNIAWTECIPNMIQKLVFD